MTVQKIKRSLRGQTGFTLIELLIVMAILGVLAVVVLIAINPAEQLKRARDTGRISAVNQLGRALTAYSVAYEGAYPATTSWSTDIVNSADLSVFPAPVQDVAGATIICTNAMVNGYCYDTGTVAATGIDHAVVFARFESTQQGNKCGTDNAFTLFSTAMARGGTWCGSTEPVATSASFIFQ